MDLDLDITHSRPCRALCLCLPREGGTTAAPRSLVASRSYQRHHSRSHGHRLTLHRHPQQAHGKCPPLEGRTHPRGPGAVEGSGPTGHRRDPCRSTGVLGPRASSHEAMMGLAQNGQPSHQGSPARRSAMKPASVPTPAPAPAQDVVVLFQRLTSFMALRDPELMATAAAVVGTDTLIPLVRK